MNKTTREWEIPSEIPIDPLSVAHMFTIGALYPSSGAHHTMHAFLDAETFDSIGAPDALEKDGHLCFRARGLEASITFHRDAQLAPRVVRIEVHSAAGGSLVNYREWSEAHKRKLVELDQRALQRALDTVEALGG